MNEELAIIPYEASAQLAVAKASGKNYNVTIGGTTTRIVRDVDFGVIPKTKKPTLYKSGAEIICMGYGLLQQYEIESKIEQYHYKVNYFVKYSQGIRPQKHHHSQIY